MPHHADAAQRTRRYFGSGERDSGVEHLVHLSKLTEVKSAQFAQSVEAPAPMASRLRRRQEDEETHIRTNNAHLFDKLVRHNTLESRRKHHLNLVPIEEQKTFFQGSNRQARLLAARKIDEDNGVLFSRLAETRPFLDRQKLEKTQSDHEKLVKRISRFKPHQPFAGANLIFATTGKPEYARHPQPQTARPTWQPLLTHDVVSLQRAEDEKLRGGLPPREETSSATRKVLRDPNAWCNRDENYGPAKPQETRTPRPPPRRLKVLGPEVYQQGGVFHQLQPQRPRLADAAHQLPEFAAQNPPTYATPGSAERQRARRDAAEASEGQQPQPKEEARDASADPEIPEDNDD